MRRFAMVPALSIFGILLVVVVAAGPLMSQVEIPAYTVERRDGAIELRDYPAMVVATINVSGDRGAAINQGFRALANYIFGANTAAAKIAMTAPVMQSRSDDVPGSAWTIRFIMPRTFRRDSLPAPKDGRVTVDAVQDARFAVIRFTGFWRDALLARQTDDLRAWMARRGLTARGMPIYAFYDPPWTLPMFRRNEVMIEIATAPGGVQ